MKKKNKKHKWKKNLKNTLILYFFDEINEDVSVCVERQNY